MAIKKGGSTSHAISGGQKRLERKEIPSTSLGPREPNEEKASSLSISALAALRQQKGNAKQSSSNSRKRGHARKAENRAKLERAVGNADRLQMKASKRSARDEKRKRAKEVLQ
ncbi:uncharacterized protein FA14DRAFT_180822 [Meira miltonrushii]|uniref:BZIP domain-containing protein n=1 Tax=Meira miltonrushii TaxID=1280837 RepID=A0A316VFE6_9BASI|nr:uncharacterized protein FA14DRAFT_180822 [Meira miltonrushii]PWN34195.1 hypothetical protein FA14DRAFT_180822 [Meira miltonrushii]